MLENRSRPLFAALAAVTLLVAGGAFAVTPKEQAELDANERNEPGPASAPTGVGIQCPPGTTEQTFYLEDFEAGTGGWAGSGVGEWERGAPVTLVFEGCDSSPRPEPSGAFSGTNVFGTNLNGCYANSGAESVLARSFDFSSLAAPIQLSWTNWYEVFTPFDIGEVRANATVVFSIVPSTATANYQAESADLSAYAGNGAVTIDFRLFATTVVNRMGWYVDDVEILYCGAAEADVSIAKIASPTQVAPGDALVYTITVTNNGPGDATGVTVTDTLPAGVSYVGNDCGASFVDPTLTWNAGALANGASAVCNVSTTVDPDAAGALVNGASVTASSSDPNGGNDTAAAAAVVALQIQAIPALGPAGFVVLALFLAAIATVYLLRRRRA
jgi:uncharacterized repeat protein (TIGR01451 family)